MASLNFLDIESFTKNLVPVTVPELFSRTNEFHMNGLFSELIFGEIGSSDRRKTYSYINLHTDIIHPTALKILIRLDRRIQKFISGEESFSLSNGELTLDPDGITGLSNFKKILPKIKFRGESKQRNELIKVIFDSINFIFISKLPVIPPDFRLAYQDEDGNWNIDPLNDIYQSIIRKSIQIASIGKGSVLFDLLSYGIQNSIIDHDKFVKTKVEKKNGIIRSQLLGKRIDFSGRAVITPDPMLKVNQVGIPFRIAVVLFEPFLIHKALNYIDKESLEKEINQFMNTSLSIDSIRKITELIKNDDKIPSKLYDIFWNICKDCMIGKSVICKRDPALHAESIRGFTPILVSGNTLRLCTLQTGGFNADFDGDQMAVYLPLSNQSQEEIKSKLMRISSGDSSRKLVFDLSKEMYVGLYLISKNKVKSNSPLLINESDIDSITDPYIQVKYRNKIMTSGKAIINSCFPNDFPFVNNQLDKKKIKVIIQNLVQKYDQDTVIDSVSKLAQTGFKWATIMAPAFSIDDIKLPQKILDMKKKLNIANTEQSVELIKQMEKILIEYLKDSGLYDLMESGAGKGWGQPSQILIAKGIIADPKGRVLPTIKGSFAEGLTAREFFDASAGARKGLGDRVLNTSSTGYLARKLAYLLNSVELDIYLKDCGTTRTLKLKLDKNIIPKLSGRYIIHKSKLVLFNPENFKSGDIVNLRSPVYCKSKKICHTCYGKLLERHKSPYVGLLAASIMGEVSTQTIMRSFHLGGAIKIKKRNVLKDLAENNMELSY